MVSGYKKKQMEKKPWHYGRGEATRSLTKDEDGKRILYRHEGQVDLQRKAHTGELPRPKMSSSSSTVLGIENNQGLKKTPFGGLGGGFIDDRPIIAIPSSTSVTVMYLIVFF